MKSTLMMLITILMTSGTVQAKPGTYDYLGGARVNNRETKRWTLQEWLETKDRNRMMDLWLSMNSASPFEAMVGASYKSYLREVDTPKSQTSFNSVDGVVIAHAHIVGLTGEFENNTQENYTDLTGMLNLRLFGESIQSTYLALHFGQRTRTYTSFSPQHDYKNQFGQVSLQLYLMKYFGIDGYHRIYIPGINDNQKEEMTGTLSEAGIFIDFKALRVFGSAYRDVQTIRSTITPYSETTTIRSGTKAGTDELPRAHRTLGGR